MKRIKHYTGPNLEMEPKLARRLLKVTSFVCFVPWPPRAFLELGNTSSCGADVKFPVAKSLPGRAPGRGPKVVPAASLSLARAPAPCWGLRSRRGLSCADSGRRRRRRLRRARACNRGATRFHPGSLPRPLPPRRILTRCVVPRHRILRSGSGLRADAAPAAAETERREGAQRPQAAASKRRQLCSRPTPARAGQQPLPVGKERSGLLPQPHPSTPVPGTPASPTAAWPVPRRVRAAASLVGPP